MLSHALWRPQPATVAIAGSTFATASTSDEMLLLDNDIIVSQAYYSNSPLFAFDSSSLGDLQQLLQSEAFKQNMSLTLNISTENLTDLLNTAQLNQTRELPQQQLPMSALITLTVFYAIIFVAGVLGNLITCIVISRNKFMHTATNFYLFNLAVSDLMLLLSGAPQDVYSYWYPNAFPFGDAICILGSVLAETATNATVLTITAFTVERYIAICHPFRQHTMSKLSRAIKFIFAIWVAALLLALPQAMQFSVVSEQGGTSCTIGNHFVEHVFAVSGFIFFGGPMTAICVLYVLIGIKLKRSRLLQAVPRRSLDVHRGISAQSRVIRMLIAVAVAFFLCWAPFHAQRLMAVYGSSANIDSQLFKDVFEAVDLTSGVLYYLSTCINPLLYNIMSHKFRDAFKVTLARQFGFPGRSQSQSHNYSALLRQNGSMRLHTTDSIRTTTTTTTINSSGGMGGNSVSRHSSHRSRYTSLGSQSPLTTTLTKRDEIVANQINGITATTAAKQQQQQKQHHHMLQTQLSQRSNGTDSNILLDMELGTAHNFCHGHPQSSAINCNRSDNLRRSVISNSMVHAARNARPLGDDRMSINSQEWDSGASQYELGDTLCMGELESELARPDTPNSLTMARMAGAQLAPTIQPVNSIAELDVHGPARTRLKLSRIISRRDQDTLLAKSMPRAELMRSSTNMPNVPGSPFTTYENDKKKQARNTNGGRPHKTFDTLTGIFHWPARKKQLNGRHVGGVPAAVGSGGSRQNSISATHTHTSSTGTPTPRMALMRSISSASSAMLESTLNVEMIGQKL
ncbi:PREDICTED: neuropeptide SIFamide receptor-like isoform X2 [Bactrocera latifrons]|uniref:neuropeptide SIFamide receptor-like isoform X2 n=1 Tax=Bactrocera latifrons TaxID=174628 RepID=UPI0008DE2746|nr:PREDICTED: neuropeptide SIFamide receptor-like isoform X2 [Bactrocera latifrons]